MITCPQCGTENLPGMAYCEHCGSPLAAPAVQPPAHGGDADPGAAAAIAQAQSVLDQLDSAQSAPAAPAQGAQPANQAAPPADQGKADAPPVDQAAAPPAAPGTLSIIFPDGAEFAVSGDTTNIGRSDIAQNWHPELDVIPFGGGAPDLGVSRHQAVIQRQDGNYVLVDVGSTNGTFVNGKALEYNKPVELHDGDAIAFGAFNTKVRIQ